jgi:ribosomal protein S18 acetylase RimI-like enzyme
MSAYKVTSISLTPELKAQVYQEFAKHAINSIGFDGLASEPIVFEIGEDGASLGICVCQLFWGNLHIKYLLTKEEHRGRGVARTLMKHAFAFGKENGCRFAFVETMSFQAPEFYQKLGFEIELKRDGYASGTSFYYLRRDL